MSGIPDKELGIEDVIQKALKVYRDRFPLFYVPSLVAYLPAIALQLIVFAPIMNWMNDYMSNLVQVSYTGPPQFDPNIIGFGILLGIGFFLLELIVTGFSIIAASRVMGEAEIDAMAILGETTAGLWRLLGATLVMGLGMMAIFIVPFFFALLPGYTGVAITFLLLIAATFGSIYLALRLMLYTQTTYLEKVGIISSLKRSFVLLKGRVLLTLVLMIALLLISVIPNVLVGQLTGFPGLEFWYISAFLSMIATSLAAPLQPIALTIWYYSMRSRETPTQVPSPPPILFSTEPPPPG